MREEVVKVKNLSKDFSRFRAVDNISFAVKSSEIFGLLGPNGAGKTTIINILCTLLVPTSGEVMVNGFNVVNFPDQVRRSIGIIFQDPSLDERLTAYENLNFHGMIYHLPLKVRKERIKEVLEIVGLYAKKDDIVRTFSGGMRRRLEIARGLMHRPKIIFLDEPTIGLDPQTRYYIWDYILSLSQKEGITMFLTTHYMDEAEICQRVAIIDYGKIIALDSPQQLKSEFGLGSLNEVFLKLTNHNMREEEGSAKKQLHQIVRAHRLR